MKRILIPIIIGTLLACQAPIKSDSNVISSDIDLFWKAYDQIIQETQHERQMELLDSLYVQAGSEGVRKMIEAKNYQLEEYVELINLYPKFWNSIRENTYRSKEMADKLNMGIEKLRAIYPELKPAKIYFTIGAMRSNGTTRDSTVLIGSELAMGDSNIDISEFEGRTKEWLENFFGADPIDALVLLNVHEYVHTQQNPIASTLLYQVIYEGVAEFLSVKAMKVPSNTPAIEYGKNNPKVKEKFEKEMFFERTYDWLWSNSPNEFETRDLGYYIGYAIAERYYELADDKAEAVRELIAIDYNDTDRVDALIDGTGFFSKSIQELRKTDQAKRPKVTGISQFENGEQNVDPETTEITLEFSETLNAHNTSIDYGALGAEAFPKITDRYWSQDSSSWTMKLELKPETRYQIHIGNNFRNTNNIPLLPYLIDFRTGK